MAAATAGAIPDRPMPNEADKTRHSRALRIFVGDVLQVLMAFRLLKVQVLALLTAPGLDATTVQLSTVSYPCLQPGAGKSRHMLLHHALRRRSVCMGPGKPELVSSASSTTSTHPISRSRETVTCPQPSAGAASTWRTHMAGSIYK